MGATVGVLVTMVSLFLVGMVVPPSIAKFFMNPIVLMILAIAGGFIGDTIEETGRVDIKDLKEAVKGGAGVTFSWFAIWIVIAAGVGAIMLFFKVLGGLPTNY